MFLLQKNRNFGGKFESFHSLPRRRAGGRANRQKYPSSLKAAFMSILAKLVHNSRPMACCYVCFRLCWLQASLLWFLLWFFSLGPLAYFHKNKNRLLPLRWHDTLCPVNGSETLRVSGDQLYQHFLCLMACEVEPAYTGSLMQQQCQSSSQPSGNWSGALAT